MKNVLLIDYAIFLTDVAYELKESGYNPVIIKAKYASYENYIQLIDDLEPEFIFTINFSPEIAFLASRKKIKYLSWTVDPMPDNRFSIIPGTDLNYSKLFVHQNNLIDRFKSAGITKIEFMPLAAPKKRRYQITDQNFLAPYKTLLSFVGNSLNSDLKAIDKVFNKWGFDFNLKDSLLSFFAKDAFQIIDSVAFKGFNKHNFGEILGKKFESSLEYLNENQLPRFINILNDLASSVLRVERVKSCLKHNITVYGDEYWKQIAGNNFKGKAHHGEELTKIYNASTFNLDMPRIYQRDILTMRVFDVLSCQSILLAEKSSEIEKYFTDDKELILYENSQDLNEKIVFYQNHPELLIDIALNGRVKILNEHTIKQRVNTILKDCS